MDRDAQSDAGAGLGARRVEHGGPADLLVAAGLAIEGRLDLGTATWLYIAAGASAVVLGERYKVGGVPVVDTSRAEASASVGLGVAIR